MIDWTKPVETVDGLRVTVIAPMVICGLPADETMGRISGENTHWEYLENGTVGNDFLPDLRNIAE